MRKKESRKHTILQTALKLFSSRGFHQTTMSDLADTMDVSVGTLYNYFSSKQILAREALAYVSDALSFELRSINQTPLSSQEKIQQFVGAYFRVMKEMPEMLEYFFRVYLVNRDLFCDQDGKCIFGYIETFILEVRTLIDNGIREGALKERDFCIAFALIVGTLGAVNFLRGETMLEERLEYYEEDLSRTLFYALSH